MHTPLIKKLVLAVLGMFAFAFALVPLYDVFCDITGLNGKVDLVVAEQSESVDASRVVDVSFTTHAKSSAPFSVEAQQYSVTVQPGKLSEVEFVARNLSDSARIMQAIPSVSPGQAAKYLHKLACFCFDQQSLQANQTMKFTLRFYVDTELPADVQELTLSYTLYDITDSIATSNLKQKNAPDQLVHIAEHVYLRGHENG
ncbi:cytochrome c oxidase assembly protein [Pseudoalteromonas luteoviolacea]|uniref:cytochrome c oxidase assembly protein n=1 Tax=Pseudoalteromonas luteoviolacea TaxID=43657 RepID=UPI001B358E49|nr:cytochrome c oxidase assembly protein [Pseudoalteromonas luteoviolacea]MBQ4813768.1 cytochrome c oxidase assembly protein [Pseudoalteromonas luteoviolacea]